jgi:phosphatidylglycerol:prolipoprotein diacylglycerol transferase
MLVTLAIRGYENMAPYIYIVLPSFIALAFIGGFFALLFIYFRIDKFGVKFMDLVKVFVICGVAAFIGAKILSFLTMIPWFVENLSVNALLFAFLKSGITFYGGLFGVLLALKIYIKFGKYEKSAVYHMIVPAIPLFHVFGRIGCFFAGCCYGVVLKSPFARFGLHVNRVPTQIIEAVFNVMLFLVIIIIEKKRKEWDSLRFYLLSYATFRFVIEFFRGDVERGIYFSLSASQWISMAIVAYYAIKHLREIKQNRELRHIQV